MGNLPDCVIQAGALTGIQKKKGFPLNNSIHETQISKKPGA